MNIPALPSAYDPGPIPGPGGLKLLAEYDLLDFVFECLQILQLLEAQSLNPVPYRLNNYEIGKAFPAMPLKKIIDRLRDLARVNLITLDYHCPPDKPFTLVATLTDRGLEFLGKFSAL